MLINTEILNKKFLVSYFDSKGDVAIKEFPIQEFYAWETTTRNDQNKSDQYINYNGEPVRRKITKNFNKFSIVEFLYHLPQEDQDEIFSFNMPKLHFCDIETEVNDKSSRNIEEYTIQAINSVNCIAIVNPNFTVDFLSFLPIDLDSTIAKVNTYIEPASKHKYTLNTLFFKSEKEMLEHFFYVLMPKIPLLTGWNFLTFDWFYLTNRAINLDIDITKCSPTGKIDKKNYNTPIHRVIMDYLEFVKKWDRKIKIKENLTLDYISEYVTKLKKIKYDGRLEDLFHNDFSHYAFYNIIDAILVQLIHFKLRTIDVPLTLSALCRTPVYKNGSAVMITETVLFNNLLKNNMIVTDDYLRKSVIKRLYILNWESVETLRKEIDDRRVVQKIINEMVDNVFTSENEFLSKLESILNKNDYNTYKDIVIDSTVAKYEGAFVKDPIVGKHLWCACFDFQALYPTTMCQYNISIESLLDKIQRKDVQDRRLEEKTNIICANGAVFDPKDSILRKIILEFKKRRKTEKGKMFEYKTKIDKAKKAIEILKGQLSQIES